MKHRLFLSFILILCCNSIFAGEYEYGLKIVTYPSTPDRFTSFSLDEGRIIPARKSPITMDFELMNRHENVFGCIFRIITDKGYNIDMMYTADREDRRYPILVCGAEVNDVPTMIEFDKWIPVSITLNPKTGDITFNYGGKCILVNDENIKGSVGYRISFGHCRFSGYSLDDVASVNIREIQIMRGSRTIRHWPLSCHDGDYCTDDIGASPAMAVNPEWMLDQYITWDRILTREYHGEPSLAYDNEDGLFITTDGRWMECIDVEDASVSVIDNIGGKAPINAPDQLLYTGEDIFSYNVDDALYARFNKQSRRWEGADVFTPESHYWNKASVWWEGEKALVSFGGYGFYHYNNELMIQYPYSDKEDVKVVLEGIHPRYSAATAIIGDTLYIFGGRGNPSGKQELSPRKYYDLYSVDLRTFELCKLWEFDENPEYEFVPSGNMIYDKDRNCFYVFTNLEGGTLISISPEKQGFELMSLPVTFLNNAQYNFFNLCLGKGGEKLYGLIVQSQIDSRATVHVIRMNYPPIKVDSLRQNVIDLAAARESGRDRSYLWWIVPALLLAAGVFFFRRKGAVKTAGGIADQASEKEAVQKVETFYNFSKSSIRFFGGFCVTDKEGNNITSQFTPTLKALIVLLILSTCRDSAGIISNRLNRILWPYKPEDTANNNRNVYISKLRPILECIGDITVNCQNRFWSINFGESVQCDYVEARRLLEEELDETGIAHLLELLLSGMMLPNMEQDWVDDFKNEFSTLTIDFLTKQLQRKDLTNETLLKICDTVFQHDFLNEDALKVKCRVLYGQGKVGLAKSAYDSFCKEYTSSLGMEYPTSLKQIVS